MQADILIKILRGEHLTLADIHQELYEMCDREHASCNDECLVYRLNGSKVPNESGNRHGCDCFKSGHAMAMFIGKKLNIL